MTWRSRDLAHFTAPLSFPFDEATARFSLPPERDLRRTRTINLSVQAPSSDLVAEEISSKTESIRRYFHYTFELYERIFESLAADEAFWIPPIHKIRHPMIFYLGHTASFYINKLVLAGLTTRINQRFEEMFAVGVDEMSWDDLNEGHYDWPMVHEVWAYRRAVRERVDDLFRTSPAAASGVPLPLTFDNSTSDDRHSFFWTIMMGIEHERIHLETASIHLRELPMRLVRDTGFWPPYPKGETDLQKAKSRLAATAGLVAFQGGSVLSGRQPNDPQYGWDCDYSHDVRIQVAPFQASERLVSNSDFQEFIAAGGYENKDLWDDEGWRWVSWKKPTHPWFWVKADSGTYKLRVQVQEIALPWDWPVELNHLEARAYCNFVSKQKSTTFRLLTEAEWLVMRDESVGDLGDQWSWKANRAPGNINFELDASSVPVDQFKQGRVYDAVGNVWQHCETPVYPYKGFRVHPFYDDFSMPTFDGRHLCMRGGCWIATGNEATRDARYAFRRHFFQSIGVRLVVGSQPVDEKSLLVDCLGMDPDVDLAAEESFVLADADNIRVKVADVALRAFHKHGGKQSGQRRALDILCGAGRSTFDLAKSFDEAIGVEFSARMLQPAFAIREKGNVQFSRVSTSTGHREQVTLKAFPFEATRQKAYFYQADPANLHAHLDKFDLVVSYRAIEKTYAPQGHIAHVASRLNPGGIAVVISSFETECTSDSGRLSFNLEDALTELGGKGIDVLEGPTSWTDAGAQLFESGKPLEVVSNLKLLVVRRRVA